MAGSLHAQEQKSVLQLADEAYSREEYAVASGLYKRQARGRENKTPVTLLLKMAHSYRETGNFTEAANCYRQITARQDAPVATHFAYAETLRQLEQYDSARQQYALFSTDNADSIKLKEIGLRGCDSAVAWRSTAVNAQLKPIKELNTPGSDIVTGVAGNGLLIMSNGYRKLVSNVQPQTDLRTLQPYYNAYVYQQNTDGNPVMRLEELAPELLRKYDYHIGPVSMNKTEDTLYATINIQGKGSLNGVRQLQVWQSVKTGGKWAQLALLPGINTEGHSSSHAVLNTTGNVLYFVSDRPGGYGQTDLWYCEKQADGSWGTPVNCGEKINTVAAETFPTVNEEGILYFSSKGFAGFGGYDIYRIKGEKASWETPENMKAPFNSGADDIGLVLKKGGTEGYLSSNKQGGAGSDDVYSFTLSPAISDHIVHQLVSEPVIPKKPSSEEENEKRSIEQLKFSYDYNSADLLAESRSMLDKVSEAMSKHPNWKIVVSSFADNRGSDQYNIDLSSERCLSVINYLVAKGIDPKRIYYFNKGELEPLNGCKDGVPCNEEEHRQNRRSELKIL